MICPNCQKEISNDSTFCFNCGVSVKQPDSNQEINKENFSEENLNLNNENNKEPISENQFQSDYAPPADTPHYTYNSDTKSNVPQKDPGELYAILSLVFGILSIFSGPLFSIISLIFVKEYHKEGSGLEESKVKIGKILSIISLIIYGLGILAVVLLYGFMLCVAVFGATELATLPLA